MTLEGSTKKEKLLFLLRNCTERHITLSITNPDMAHSEYITVFKEDFEEKADAIERGYDDNLILYRNDRVKIEAVLGLTLLEDIVYIY